MLEIRPLFLRKAERTRGHALVSILALKLVRELERRIREIPNDFLEISLGFARPSRGELRQGVPVRSGE